MHEVGDYNLLTDGNGWKVDATFVPAGEQGAVQAHAAAAPRRSSLRCVLACRAEEEFAHEFAPWASRASLRHGDAGCN